MRPLEIEVYIEKDYEKIAHLAQSCLKPSEYNLQVKYHLSLQDKYLLIKKIFAKYNLHKQIQFSRGIYFDPGRSRRSI